MFFILVLIYLFFWRKKVGFLHPNCAQGGGGERVLWIALDAMKMEDVIVFGQKTDMDVIYKQFGVKPKVKIYSIPFSNSKSSLLFQALRFFMFGLLSILRQPVDLLIDTQGLPFIYPVCWLLRIKVISYTHYPIISKSTRLDHRILRFWYKWSLKCASLVFVNSTWTYNQIKEMVPCTILYPPCFQHEAKQKTNTILSLAQFRPEKNHNMQIRAFALAVEQGLKANLIFVGGCRDISDIQRVKNLQQLAMELKVDQMCKFVIDAPLDEVKKLLETALVGLHSMKDEHFGIVLVEYMAAGVIPVAHNSGGPKEDIVKPFKGQRTGYLCSTEQEYADALLEIFQNPSNEISIAAQNQAKQFSESSFQRKWMNIFNA